MTRRQETTHDELQAFEKWPLAALFLANALNVFLLYVPTDEMPSAVLWLLPWVRVGCGIAAAVSLEGTLIAVTMGRRLGRDSGWSWATMFAAAAFTAAVAYYVHASVGLAAAGLFMAQAVVLFIYTQHLAQPRKGFTPETSSMVAVNQAELLSTKQLADFAAARVAEGQVAEHVAYPEPVLSLAPKLRRCKFCGEMHPISVLGSHGRNHRRYGCCVKL